MSDYTITLTDTEEMAMQYAANGVQDWIDNAVHNRARIAIEEIVALNTAHCNANEIAIAVGRDAQVAQAFELGVVKTAHQRNLDFQNSIK